MKHFYQMFNVISLFNSTFKFIGRKIVTKFKCLNLFNVFNFEDQQIIVEKRGKE